MIKNIHILNNFLVPYLDDMQFITKKSKDFKDFKLICKLLYIGAHKNEKIKSIILKLSLTMNNYRLSTNKTQKELLTNLEMNTLLNASPCINHLSDGRQIDLNTDKIIHQHTSCVYEIIKLNSKESVILKQTLTEVADFLGINIKTLSKMLDKVDKAEIQGNLVRRVSVFYKG